MIVYTIQLFFFFFFVLFLLTYVAYRCKDLSKIIAYTIAMLISAFYGLRSLTVGVDTQEYISRFNGGVLTHDYIFSHLGIYLQYLGATPQVYLFAIALITTLLLFNTIKNFTGGNYVKVSFFLALIAFLPYGAMLYINVLRQGLAIAIILYLLSLTFKYSKISRRRLLACVAGVVAILVHKTTGYVYILSILINWLREKRLRLSYVIPISCLLIFISFYAGQIMAIFDESLGAKYIAYSNRNTSEHPLLIYVKISWVLFHLVLIARLNSIKKLPPQLFSFFITIVVIGVLTVSNPLVSSRILVSADFVLPVLYAAFAGRGGKYYSIGVFSLLAYAVVSPFIFQVYDVNFGPAWR